MKKRSAVVTLGALAQETRLDIYRHLVQAGPSGVAAGDIGARLGLPLPTLSFHLAQMKHAGLILAERHGRSIRYTANYPAMNRLLAYLTENCCAGDPAVCAELACAPAATAAQPRSRSIAS